MPVKRKVIIDRSKKKKMGRPRKYKNDVEKRKIYNQKYPPRRLRPGEYLQVLLNRLSQFPE